MSQMWDGVSRVLDTVRGTQNMPEVRRLIRTRAPIGPAKRNHHRRLHSFPSPLQIEKLHRHFP